jgi:hypothetical protein
MVTPSSDFRSEMLRIQVPVDGTKHLIDRYYREVSPYQWVRETARNAVEAGATRIEYGIEWQAVELHGIYRRTIADNGHGMDPEELLAFFRAFGGGGKPIGGMHENFGIGAKISLLPWNTYGMVVISWKDGKPSMIWIARDPAQRDYGLVEIDADDQFGRTQRVSVFQPFDLAREGINYEDLKPEWIDDHGTVLVLLGDSPSSDTVLGDPNRDESAIKGIVRYLNTRMWSLPLGVRVRADTLRSQDKSDWPRSLAEATGPHPKDGSLPRRTLPLWVKGAKEYIEFDTRGEKTKAEGRLAHSGEVTLTDGTKVHWHLWEGTRPQVGNYAFEDGFIAALYEGELYDIQQHHASYRSWGIAETSVRKRLWIVVEPPKATDEQHGVYPTGDRTELRLKGGSGAGERLPWVEWGSEFAEEHVPDEILDAIRAARGGASGSLDETYRERLAGRFGTRWRMERSVVDPSGSTRVSAVGPGETPDVSVQTDSSGEPRLGTTGGTRGRARIASTTPKEPGRRALVASGVPSYVAVHKDEFDEEWHLAAWAPKYADHPEGAVLLNIDHPVIEGQITYWQSQYPSSFAESIRDEIIKVYGELSVAKVAHSEQLKSVVPAIAIDEKFRSEESLTMALLGLMAEESLIDQRLHGKVGRRRKLGSAAA